MQIVLGIALLAYVLFFATITLDEVRTGTVVAVGGAAALGAIFAFLLELPLFLFVLFKRPGSRLRVFWPMLIGSAAFVACFAAADSWVVHKLPYLHTIPVPAQ
ncbi:hypothetical protein PP724_22900 [Ralstonia solanacearum]|uniref:hypothetical protein n=1 Tax=Ralstonia solanacearum TaxID=305 RepID=UPI001FFB02B9|nr:hypothetical protein [Ralstonia solanacearum]MDC6237016.1 hypothetical protein [Ralstonia solanacearum]MDD7810581.1 hypothetical protein [Ralstonia solanacearum]